jgi:hypothetical protein
MMNDIDPVVSYAQGHGITEDEAAMDLVLGDPELLQMIVDSEAELRVSQDREG